MNEIMVDNSFQGSLYLAIVNSVNGIAAYLPQLLGALLTILIGFIVANWAKRLIVGLLESLHVRKILQATPLNRYLKAVEVEDKVEQGIGEVFRYFLLYLFFISALNTLGLTPLTQFLTGLLHYLPRLLSAVFIFVLGIIGAGFLESFVKSALVMVDPVSARLAGKATSYTIAVFVSLIALGELGIAERFINTMFVGFVGMISLAFALAFGLGAKDLVGKILEEWYGKLKKDAKRRS